MMVKGTESYTMFYDDLNSPGIKIYVNTIEYSEGFTMT